MNNLYEIEGIIRELHHHGLPNHEIQLGVAGHWRFARIMGRTAVVGEEIQAMQSVDEFNNPIVLPKPQARFWEERVLPIIESVGMPWPIQVSTAEAAWMYMDGDLTDDRLESTRPFFGELPYDNYSQARLSQWGFKGREVDANVGGTSFPLRIMQDSPIVQEWRL